MDFENVIFNKVIPTEIKSVEAYFTRVYLKMTAKKAWRSA